MPNDKNVFQIISAFLF